MKNPQEHGDYDFDDDDWEPLETLDESSSARQREGDHPIDTACHSVTNSLGGVAWFVGALTAGLARD